MHDADFGNGIERTARVTAQSFRIGNGSEEHNCVAADLNILLQSFPLFRSQLRSLWIEGQRLILIERNRKLGYRSHRHVSPAICRTGLLLAPTHPGGVREASQEKTTCFPFRPEQSPAFERKYEVSPRNCNSSENSGPSDHCFLRRIHGCLQINGLHDCRNAGNA